MCPASAWPARKAPDRSRRICARLAPTYYFAPPRVFEGLLTVDRHPNGGRRQAEAAHVRHYHRGRAQIWRGDARGPPRSGLSARLPTRIGEILVYGPLKNVLGLSNIRVAYTAGEAIGSDLFSFFRSLGVNLKQLYGQTEAFLYVTVPEGRRSALRHGRARPRPMSTSASPRMARCSSARPACSPATTGGREDRRDDDARTAM